MSRRLVVLLVAVVSAGAAWGPTDLRPAEEASSVTVAHSDLGAVAWVQTSAEWRGIALQTYAAVTRAIEDGLRDASWTAVEPLGSAPGTRRPAVIVDVDETVLDNSAYQARLVLAGEPFDEASWGGWVREARAQAVPGAATCLADAAARGVRVFYLSNRTHDLEAATRENLAALGFPLDDDVDTVLTAGEREGWTSDKAGRRAWVARDHRVLALVGDDLGDVVDGAATDPATRARLLEESAHRLGRTWFLLPNPTYGSWKRALTTASDPTPALRRALRTARAE